MNLKRMLALIAVVAVFVVGIALLLNRQESQNPPLWVGREETEETWKPQKEKMVFDKLSDVTVSSAQEVESVIPVKASFDLHFENEVSQEYVENTFSMKPSAEFDVVQVNP